MNKIYSVYKELLRKHGKQGWWPLLHCKGTNPTKTGVMQGYHPGDYSYPKNKQQQFEICVGALLTQNTSWVQAEKALRHLKAKHALTPNALRQLNTTALKNAIKPAGYFNQKAKKLKAFAAFYQSLRGRTPTREELLRVWGIGEETADSILLYAYKIPTFVVDAYTKRILARLGLISRTARYAEIKALFENNLEPRLETYQEYHALLVEHAKRHYGRGSNTSCPLAKKYITSRRRQ